MPKFQSQLQVHLAPVLESIPKLSKSTVRPLIQLAKHSIEGRALTSDTFEQLSERIQGHCDNLPELYAAVLIVIQFFLRAPKRSIKVDEFIECLKEFKFPLECIDDFRGVLFGTHGTLLAEIYNNSCTALPQAQSIVWRIDISLAHNAVARLTHPTVVFHITSCNGQVKTFEVTLIKFHKLRYRVAMLLKEMGALEKRNVLKHF